jgi:tellurite resistance protein TehA-like permease
MSTSKNDNSRASPLAADLHPAYFAMVMSTGIVSVAAQLRAWPAAAQLLLWLNIFFYATLWALTVLRFVRYRDRLVADLLSHGQSVGFFTLIAATCVLGNQFVVVLPWPQVALTLWIVGIALWAIITYTVLTVLTVKSNKPSLAQGINGGWLVIVVAAQSVSVLGGLIAPDLGASRELALYFALIMWLGGGMLYIWIISLIFYRYTFFALDPRQLAPPYWINMGAMAISTLAGTILAQNATESPLLAELRPFIIGLTLMFWATATWWIPLLVALGVWRHIVCRVSIHYDPVYWSAVFPLGMYTVCTHRLASVVNQPFLDVIPRYFLFIALGAWLVTFFGLLQRQLNWLRTH